MKTLQKILLGISLAIAPIGCATTIHGNVDLSYVPIRANEQIYEKELRTEIDIHSETQIFKTGLEIGTKSITYMNLLESPDLGGIFKPTNQDYVFYTRFKIPIGKDLLEFYVQHNCFHPVNKEYLFQYPINDREMIRFYSQGETRLGVNWKW